jgi:hypothetical protein
MFNSKKTTTTENGAELFSTNKMSCFNNRYRLGSELARGATVFLFYFPMGATKWKLLVWQLLLFFFRKNKALQSKS